MSEAEKALRNAIVDRILGRTTHNQFWLTVADIGKHEPVQDYAAAVEAIGADLRAIKEDMT